MNFFDLLTGVVAPHQCLMCGAEGRLLCADCAARVTTVPERCYSCYASSPGWLTCARCLSAGRLRSVRVAAIYEDHAKSLVWHLKLSGAQTAARTIAKLLKRPERTERTIIVPVPTATVRARQRGYDQAKLLARELSRQTRLPYHDCLARMGQAHQHGLPRRQRLAQMAGVFRVRKPRRLAGAHVVLVDDVVTTGATLEAAAMAISKAGAERIDATVFAQPDK